MPGHPSGRSSGPPMGGCLEARPRSGSIRPGAHARSAPHRSAPMLERHHRSGSIGQHPMPGAPPSKLDPLAQHHAGAPPIGSPPGAPGIRVHRLTLWQGRRDGGAPSLGCVEADIGAPPAISCERWTSVARSAACPGVFASRLDRLVHLHRRQLDGRRRGGARWTHYGLRCAGGQWVRGGLCGGGGFRFFPPPLSPLLSPPLSIRGQLVDGHLCARDLARSTRPRTAEPSRALGRVAFRRTDLIP